MLYLKLCSSTRYNTISLPLFHGLAENIFINKKQEHTLTKIVLINYFNQKQNYQNDTGFYCLAKSNGRICNFYKIKVRVDLDGIDAELGIS